MTLSQALLSFFQKLEDYANHYEEKELTLNISHYVYNRSFSRIHQELQEGYRLHKEYSKQVYDDLQSQIDVYLKIIHVRMSEYLKEFTFNDFEYSFQSYQEEKDEELLEEMKEDMSDMTHQIKHIVSILEFLKDFQEKLKAEKTKPTYLKIYAHPHLGKWNYFYEYPFNEVNAYLYNDDEPVALDVFGINVRYLPFMQKELGDVLMKNKTIEKIILADAHLQPVWLKKQLNCLFPACIIDTTNDLIIYTIPKKEYVSEAEEEAYLNEGMHMPHNFN